MWVEPIGTIFSLISRDAMTRDVCICLFSVVVWMPYHLLAASDPLSINGEVFCWVRAVNVTLRDM